MSVSVCLGGQVFGAGLIRRQEKGFVGNLRGRRQPAFEGRGVDERLEAGSWLPPCLRDAVEFVRVEIESSDQRFYGAVLGAYGDERRLYRRHVDDFPVSAVAVHEYHRVAVEEPKRVGEGQSVDVRVDLGGRMANKKKQKHTN